MDNEKPAPLPRTWEEFQINPDQYRHHPTWDLLSPAEFYETVRECDWNEIDGHTPTASMRANEWVPFPPDPHLLAETTDYTRTINTNAFTTSSRTRSDDIAETINLIDSVASHVLVRQEHGKSETR